MCKTSSMTANSQVGLQMSSQKNKPTSSLMLLKGDSSTRARGSRVAFVDWESPPAPLPLPNLEQRSETTAEDTPVPREWPHTKMGVWSPEDKVEI